MPLKSPALRGVPSTPALRASTTRNVPQRKSESNLRGSRQFNTLPTLHSSPTNTQARGHETSSPPAPFAVKQRGVYEQLLEHNPSVARHGEGWTSRNNLASASGGYGNTLSVGRSLGKTTSMMSLREKARAFLSPSEKREEKDKRDTMDLTTFEHEYEQDAYTGERERGSKRQSGGKMVQWSQSTTTIPATAGRPGTPGAISTLSMSTNTILTSTAAPAAGPTKKKGLFRNFWGKKDEA